MSDQEYGMKYLFVFPRCEFCGNVFTPQEQFFAQYGFACDNCYGEEVDQCEIEYHIERAMFMFDPEKVKWVEDEGVR